MFMKKVCIWILAVLQIIIISCGGRNQKTVAIQNSKAVSAPAANEKANANSECDDQLWKYVYDHERLQVLDKCKTVTGVIEESNADPDGDQHMLLKLDKGQKDLLLKKNKSKKDGDLVVEVVCANNITRKRAMGACTGYTNHITLPSVGDHVRVTGSYVIDSHNGWSEIHPVTSIQKI
jgi:hypothetical protein